MKNKKTIITIFTIILLLVIIGIIVHNVTEKNQSQDNEEQKNTEFSARKENFKEWDNIDTISEFPEYKGKGKLNSQNISDDTVVILYSGVTYEEAKEYYEDIINTGYESEKGNFELVLEVATAIVSKQNSEYKYRITYNETTNELSIKGSKEEL